MVSILEAFVVSFAIDAAKFKKGSEEVQDTSKRTKDVAQKTFSAIEDAGKKTAKGVRSPVRDSTGDQWHGDGYRR
jgi:hypothetical protein